MIELISTFCISCALGCENPRCTEDVHSLFANPAVMHCGHKGRRQGTTSYSAACYYSASCCVPCLMHRTKSLPSLSADGPVSQFTFASQPGSAGCCSAARLAQL